MSCYHPNLMVKGSDGAWHFKGAYTGAIHDGTIILDGKRHFLNAETGEAVEANLSDFVLVPCGQCLGCRVARSRTWANRLMMERAGYPDDQVWFLTLTYDNDHIPLNSSGTAQTLVPRDLQLFLKRLRDAAGIPGIRFYAAGEYGSRTFRPHYHMILYGLPADKLQLEQFGASEQGFKYYRSRLILKTWPFGFHTITKVDWNTCAYVARYVTKKLTGEGAAWYQQNDIVPEFARMSRRPGIGRDYFEAHKEQIMKDDTIFLADGRKCKPPPYFDKLLTDEYPTLMERVKTERRRGVEDSIDFKLANTDLDYVHLLALEGAAFREKIKKLKRRDL